MTDQLRQAAQKALEALESGLAFPTHSDVLQNLRTALEQQQAEPVACKTLCELCVKRGYDFCANAAKTTPIIISPTQPQQQAEPVEGNTLLKAFLASAKEAGVTHLQQAEPVSELQKRYLESEKAFQQQAGQVAEAVSQRKPLTIAEVEQILAQHNYELHGDRARYIVRMTEEAHGIKEGT